MYSHLLSILVSCLNLTNKFQKMILTKNAVQRLVQNKFFKSCLVLLFPFSLCPDMTCHVLSCLLLLCLEILKVVPELLLASFCILQ